MIIKDEKLVEAELQIEAPTETPPPYSLASEASLSRPSTQSRSSTLSDAPSSSTTKSTPSVVPNQHIRVPSVPTTLQRTNYVTVQRDNQIFKGAFLIDPHLPIPRLASDGETRNLRLECHNGNIDADVWLIGGEGQDFEEGEMNGEPKTRRKKATIDVIGSNGFTAVKMNVNCDLHPFALTVSVRNGGVSVGIPSSFTGPLTTRTRNGWVNVSTALAADVTTFSEIKGSKKCFVGDFPTSSYGNGEWFGSSLDINCENGRIKLYYIDEENEKSSRKRARILLGRSSDSSHYLQSLMGIPPSDN